jgi:hypothetical protein
MSVHDRLDLARWVELSPLSRLRAEARQYVLERQKELPHEYPDTKAIDDHIALMSPKWDIVVGPAAVAVNEQLRAEAIAEAYPFVNVAEPRGWSQENELMIGDMGSLYLFVHGNGSVEAVGQCY